VYPKLVLQGDVAFLDDGTVQVGSSDPTRYYRLVGPTCTCPDFTQERAPDGWCKHRIAAGIAKRAQDVLATADSDGPYNCKVQTPVPPLPEAPASVNVRLTIGGRDVQVTLRDHDETRLLQRLEALLARYPVAAPAVPVHGQGPSSQDGWCPIHHLPMRQTTKNGRSWLSHRTEQGWCKGR
jgi:hypothetical protein